MALSDVPMAAKVGGGVAGAGAVGGGLVIAGADARAWLLVIMICAAVVAVLFGVYLLFVMWSEKRKGKEVSRGVMGSAGRRGSARGKDAKSIAEEANLAEKLRGGIEKIESTGQSLYKMPWYLMVGPPGSGKTEAIRHSELKFPAGITNKMQGAGGTSGMSWWFTSEAVLIDTAGKLLMGKEADDEAGGGDEEAGDDGSWVYFLKMLRKARPKCPINGMLLAIDCRRLLADDQKKIDRDASKIARQLEVVQRTLNVRFPVYVVVTMCDLLPGFREFFKGITDPKLEQQMLGWSNPAALDTVFDPRELEDHFAEIRVRLIEERDRLLLNPVHSEDPAGRRVDEVDALFKFPNQIEKILPRLQGWLDIIFTPGEWSPKPLFLRGVYFNSAMQEGKDLDEAIARALSKDLAEVAAERDVFRRDKSYFIKDLFRQKVFRERGLVTDARSVSAAQRTARVVLVASCVLIFAVLFGAAWWASADLKSRIGDRAKFWEAVGRVTDPSLESGSVALVSEAGRYTGGGPVDGVPGVQTRTELLERAFEQAGQEISPSTISRVLAPGLGSDVLRAERVAAYEHLVSRSVGPLIDRARAELLKEESWKPARADRARAALAELARLSSLAAGGKPEAGGGPTDLLALAEFVDGAQLKEDDRKALRSLQTSLASGFSGTAPWSAWPPAALRDSAADYLARDKGGLRDALGLYVERGLGAGGSAALQTLAELRDSVRAVAEADKKLAEVTWPGEPGVPATEIEFTQRAKQWRAAFGAGGAAGGLDAAADAVEKQLTRAAEQLGAERLRTMLNAESRRTALEQSRKSLADLRRNLPPPPAPGADGAAPPEPTGRAKQLADAAALLDAAAARLAGKPAPAGGPGTPGSGPGAGGTLEAVLAELDAQSASGGWLAPTAAEGGAGGFAVTPRRAAYSALDTQLTLILGNPVEGARRVLEEAAPADADLIKADADWAAGREGAEPVSRLRRHEEGLARLVKARVESFAAVAGGGGGSGAPAPWAARLRAAWASVQLRETTELVREGVRRFPERASALQPAAGGVAKGAEGQTPIEAALGLPMLSKVKVDAARAGLARWDRAEARLLLRDIEYLNAKLGNPAASMLQVGQSPQDLRATDDQAKAINDFADAAAKFWLTDYLGALVPGASCRGEPEGWDAWAARARSEFVPPVDTGKGINQRLREGASGALRQAGVVAWLRARGGGGGGGVQPGAVMVSRREAVAGTLDSPIAGEPLDAFADRVQNRWLATLRKLWAAPSTDDLRKLARELTAVDATPIGSLLPVYADTAAPNPVLDYWRGLTRESFASAGGKAGTELAQAISTVAALADRFPANLRGARTRPVDAAELRQPATARALGLAGEALSVGRPDAAASLGNFPDDCLKDSLLRLLGASGGAGSAALSAEQRRAVALRLPVLRLLAAEPTARMWIATRPEIESVPLGLPTGLGYRKWRPKGSAAAADTTIGNAPEPLAIDARAVAGKLTLEFDIDGTFSTPIDFPRAGLGEAWGLFDLIAGDSTSELRVADPAVRRFIVTITLPGSGQPVNWLMVVELRLPAGEGPNPSWPTLEQWRTGKP